MKDTEIHEGLENKEIRDFLSKSIVDVYKEKGRAPLFTYDSENVFDNSIKHTKLQIKNLESEVVKLETLKSVGILAKNMGWEEFDISDHISKTGKMYRNFFGTEKEFEKFCKDNNIEY